MLMDINALVTNVSASTTSMVGINPGQTESFSINPTHSHVAAILSTGTGNVQFRFSLGGE